MTPLTHIFKGMSYEQASKEGLRLVKMAAKTGNWFEIIEPLRVLKSIMAKASA